MNTPFLMTVAAKQQGMLLYDFLDAQFPFFIKESWALSLVAESLKIQNKTISGNPTLNAGDTLAFSIEQYVEPAVNTHWKVYWQNTALLVAHKPANLPVQRTTRNIYNTLTALVRRDLNFPQAQPLHRLDLETAGFVLFAKDNASTKIWQPKLKDILQEKVYRAIVWGKPEWQSQSFTCRLATKPSSAIRCQMHCTPVGTPSIISSENSNEDATVQKNTLGKISTTHFKVIESFTINNDNFSIIECELLTGRKHQIRAQLAYLGHPIVGDKIYAHEGVYYLKRLNDSIQKVDDDRLQSVHHLLVASSIKLLLAGQAPTTSPATAPLQPSPFCSQEMIKLALNAADYPAAWHEFKARK